MKEYTELDQDHFDKFYYCPICMQYQYPKSDKESHRPRIEIRGMDWHG